jgi:hypothetical protein
MLQMLHSPSCAGANGANSRVPRRIAIGKKLAGHLFRDFSRPVIQPQTQNEPGRRSMIAIGASSHPGS